MSKHPSFAGALAALLLVMACSSDPEEPRPDPFVPRDLSGFFDSGLATPEIPLDAATVDVAQLLANETAIEVGILQLHEVSVTDVIPPGEGRRMLDLALSRDGLRWHAALACQYGGQAKAMTGELDPHRGRAYLLSCLRRLQRAGWFSLPQAIPEPSIGFFAASRYTVRVRLAGHGKKVELERRLPFGAELERPAREAAAAFAALLDEKLE